MDFLHFLDECVTPSHTADCISRMLEASGASRLGFSSGMAFEPGKVYFAVRGCAVIAFRMPKNISGESRFRIAMAHTDFPALKITPNPDGARAGVATLHSEVYGSPLFTSWLDRDLGYGGVLAYELGDKLQTKVFRGDKLFRIPQLAVHLNRGVNQDGLRLNPQVDLDALWGRAGEGLPPFAGALQRELPDGAELLDFDVRLFDAQPASLGGFNDEWIYSGRLDNLSSCHAILESLVNAPAAESDIQVACFFNKEEVGSTSPDGAGGNFLKSVLDSIAVPQLSAVLSDSFALSIDMAHACHPNHTEKHDPNHAPILGEGIVLKQNAQNRYAGDVLSNARFKMICKQSNISCQAFVMRNDMPCGSTVGPTVSATLGIPTVDIGEPMLSMHSIREMTAVKDHESMIRLVSAFFA